MSDLTHLLQASRIEVKEHGTNVGREHVNICCPYCDESKFHCGIHEYDYWFKCFVCGEGGSWGKLRYQLRKVYPYVDWSLIKNKNKEVYLDDEKKPHKAKDMPVFWREVDERDIEVLEWLEERPNQRDLKEKDRERGLDIKIALDAGLMIGIKKLKGYIVFKNGENINARKYYLDSPGPRWWKRLKDRPYLFGKEWTEKMNPKVGVITEGIFDCLRIPFGYGVAILGSAVSELLVSEIIKAFPTADTLVLALDRDANKNSITQMRLMLMDLGYEVKTVDWNSISRKEIKDLDDLFLSISQKKFFNFVQIQNIFSKQISLL